METPRAYRAGDAASLLETWNAALSSDPLNLQRLTTKIFCDPNMEASGLPVVCDSAGNVIAFAYATHRRVATRPDLPPDPDPGWVNAFGVHPQWRGRGLGSACLEAALSYLRRAGCCRVRVDAFSPRYITPGVDIDAYPAAAPFLTSIGFQPDGEAVSMQASLVDFEPTAGVLAAQAALRDEGVVVEPLSPDWLVDLVVFIRQYFQATTAQVLQDAVTHGANLRQVWIARESDAIVGYGMYGIYDGNLERFGPFGVRPDQRGRRIGKVLLHRVMAAMQAQGLRLVWFQSTDETSVASHLYRQAGFNTVRRFRAFQRAL